MTAKEIENLITSFDLVGDIAIIEIPGELKKKEKIIAKTLLGLHKNIKVVLDANTLLDQDRYEIILIGGDFSRVFQSNHLELAPNSKKVGYLNDEELKALYYKAAGLIFPSLYEGFGLPLVEAMTCSCPVICSDIPSSREVCGEAALYFDAEQPEDLANKLEMILNNSSQAEELIKRGTLQSRNFSWMKTAQETKQILERYL